MSVISNSESMLTLLFYSIFFHFDIELLETTVPRPSNFLIQQESWLKKLISVLALARQALSCCTNQRWIYYLPSLKRQEKQRFFSHSLDCKEKQSDYIPWLVHYVMF